MLHKEVIDGTNIYCKTSHWLARGYFGRAEGDTPQTHCAGVSALMACVCFLVVTIDKI